MSDKDYEAISAIALEAPERIGMMIASTPRGRRAIFYKLCTDAVMKLNIDPPVYNTNYGRVYDYRQYSRKEATGWKQFHFPSLVNPEWSPKMEKELRAQFTHDAYLQEVYAEFGTEMIGVFNKDYVDEASSYGYDFLDQPKHGAPIAIGIDWDKFGAETQIVVLQYEPSDRRRARPELGIDEPGYGRFRVINRISIPKSEMSYDIAVQKVFELDEAYSPFAIYPDRGAGEYQIEMLRKRLGDKVRGIHFGSSHEVRDPISRVVEKKPMKPFLVNQTVLMLERGQLRLPDRHKDEVLFKQMNDYQVVRVSERTQQPSYTNKNEHALDAMMLALFAFIDEMPDLVNTVEKPKSANQYGMFKQRYVDPLKQVFSSTPAVSTTEWDEPGRPPLTKVPVGTRKSARVGNSMTWGGRGSGGFGGRSKF